jgi:hypothetical protein
VAPDFGNTETARSAGILRIMSGWIRFEFNGQSASGKTKRWLVISTFEPHPVLGTIAWYASWRCYSFYPKSDTVFEKACLRDIANFCEEETNAHRAKQKLLPS